jgi:hypothetical protein
VSLAKTSTATKIGAILGSKRLRPAHKRRNSVPKYGPIKSKHGVIREQLWEGGGYVIDFKLSLSRNVSDVKGLL